MLDVRELPKQLTSVYSVRNRPQLDAGIGLLASDRVGVQKVRGGWDGFKAGSTRQHEICALNAHS